MAPKEADKKLVAPKAAAAPAKKPAVTATASVTKKAGFRRGGRIQGLWPSRTGHHACQYVSDLAGRDRCQGMRSPMVGWLTLKVITQVTPAASSTATKKAPAAAAAGAKKPAGTKSDAQPGGKKKDSSVTAEHAPPEVDPVAEAEAARLKAE